MSRTLYAALFAALLLTACYVGPEPRRGYGYVVAPALPVIVEIGVEPYYYHSGYYYYYHDRNWSYSHSKAGPWRDLPRDRYPREVRHRDGRGGDHDGRGDDRDYRR